jgi:hypothetical protein
MLGPGKEVKGIRDIGGGCARRVHHRQRSIELHDLAAQSLLLGAGRELPPLAPSRQPNYGRSEYHHIRLPRSATLSRRPGVPPGCSASFMSYLMDARY